MNKKKSLNLILIFSLIFFSACSTQSNNKLKENIDKKNLEEINFVENIKDERFFNIFLSNELKNLDFLSSKYNYSYYYGVDTNNEYLLFSEDNYYLITFNSKNSFMNSIPKLTNGSSIKEFDNVYTTLFSSYFKKTDKVDLYYTPSFLKELHIIYNKYKIKPITKTVLENKMIEIFKNSYGDILKYHKLNHLNHEEYINLIRNANKNKLFIKNIEYLNIKYVLNYELLLPIALVSSILDEKNKISK